MVNKSKRECSFSVWYPRFAKESLESTFLTIPGDVLKYLRHDAFVLPLEATAEVSCNSEWSDGSPVNCEPPEDGELQPTFPEFSQGIQDAIDEYGAIFVKSNWSTPSDATWVTPTKTLKCTSLEEVYLLLKSSDRVSEDLSAIEKYSTNDEPLQSSLVLKRWRDVNPSTEFRCFVVENELVGICQRDVSQYHRYIESEKYDIRRDIKSLFSERIKDRFNLDNYAFDVIRHKKDRVKIVDFAPLDESTTSGTLFGYEELRDGIIEPPEFRFIAEDVGIQPKASRHFCVPREIDEYFRSTGDVSVVEAIRREVENQNDDEDDAGDTE